MWVRSQFHVPVDLLPGKTPLHAMEFCWEWNHGSLDFQPEN
jgi:hypothetical protein